MYNFNKCFTNITTFELIKTLFKKCVKCINLVFICNFYYYFDCCIKSLILKSNIK